METWIISDNPSIGSDLLGQTFYINFESNETTYELINFTTFGPGGSGRAIFYDSDGVYFSWWSSQAYRTVTFDTAPTGDLLTWLQANGVKQSGITDLTGYIWRANEYISPTNISFDIGGSVKNTDFTPYNFIEFNYNSDYGVNIFAFYYFNIPEPYTPGDGFIYIPQNSLGFAEGWYFGNTSDMSSYVMVAPPTVKFTGGSDVGDTDLISWLQDNGTLSLLDTTMWQLNSAPDLSTDLDVSIDNSDVSWNTCEYYDNGEVKIAAWSFDNVQVSTNGYVLWVAAGIPNFGYFYNSQVFDAVIAQFEAQGFTIDQSDITSKSGYFYVESIDNTTGKFHNVRRDVIRFNSDDWDSNTDFTNWLTNNAEQLDEYVIPNDVVEIGYNAFYNCSSFETITIPNSVTSIGEYAFCGSNLTSITIPDSVTEIGYRAFSFCPELTSITTLNNVTSIGEDAFYDCISLTDVTIGNCVTLIGQNAFLACDSLTGITIKATIPPSKGNNVFDHTNDCPIYVPSQSVNAYKTDWSDYADRIQAMPISLITLDLSTLNLPEGTHSIQIRLSDNGVTKRDSELSNAVTYTVSSWENPVQDGDNLTITQAHTISQSGDTLTVE